MHIVNSTAEQSALLAVIDLGARLAEHPEDAALRRLYFLRRSLLREHARAGALIHRNTTCPTPRRIHVDPRGLAAFLAGADK